MRRRPFVRRQRRLGEPYPVAKACGSLSQSRELYIPHCIGHLQFREVPGRRGTYKDDFFRVVQLQSRGLSCRLGQRREQARPRRRLLHWVSTRVEHSVPPRPQGSQRSWRDLGEQVF